MNYGAISLSYAESVTPTPLTLNKYALWECARPTGRARVVVIPSWGFPPARHSQQGFFPGWRHRLGLGDKILYTSCFASFFIFIFF